MIDAFEATTPLMCGLLTQGQSQPTSLPMIFAVSNDHVGDFSSTRIVAKGSTPDQNPMLVGSMPPILQVPRFCQDSNLERSLRSSGALVTPLSA